MNVIIDYDISGGHPDHHAILKQHLKAKGYGDAFRAGEVNYNLPNTTLWKANIPNTQTAKDDFDIAVRDINSKITFSNKIIIERFIALEFTNSFSAIPGKAHSS